MNLLRLAIPIGLLVSFLAPLNAAHGESSPVPAKATTKAKRPNPKAAKPAPKPLPEIELPEAPAEQISAAERVFYGVYDCEFNQTINIAANVRHFGYVDVKHGKADYVMKPVLSSTGAIRLEDVRGETLMVQISSKSMLLNVVTAQRLVDECINPKQRELIEAARVAKAAAAASAAESGPLLDAAPGPVAAAASQPR